MRFHIPMIAGAVFTLGACATSPTGAPTIGGISVADVQAWAVKICSFQPTADMVLTILSANNPAAIGAEAVGAAICSLVAPAPPAAAAKRQGVHRAYVYIPPNIVISGNFVR